MQLTTTQLGIVIGLFISLALLSLYFILNYYKCIAKHRKELEEARKDSIKRSKSIVRAAVNEEIIPLFEGFPYQIGDMKLFGKPVDYVVFDGMSEFRDGNNDKDITIIMADLKTGKAVKTSVQKAIMNAIENGRIRFEEWRIDENNKLKIK